MINNSIFRAYAQVCYNLDVRVKHEHDRKRKMLKHDNIIEQSGRSMIEMLGVLAIVGVLSVGGIAGYSKAMEKFKINKTIDQVSQIVTNIRTLYAQQTIYAGIHTNMAIKIGAIPDEMITTEGSYNYIRHSFGNRISLNTFGDMYSLDISGLPKNACITLTTMDWGNISSSGLYGITIAGETNSDIYSDMTHLDWNDVSYGKAYSSKYLPLPVATANSLCNCTSDTCFVTLYYKLL